MGFDGSGMAANYLLRYLPENNGTGDQDYANAQSINTIAEGIWEGTLTTVEADGTLAVVSNEMAITAQGTPAWGDLGFYSQEITKAFGITLVGVINLSTWEEIGLGWHSAGAVVDPDSAKFAIQANTTDGQLDAENGTTILTGLSTSTDYPIAILLGGYDVNGVPWKTGDAGASFLYGASYYYKTGSTWELIWKNVADNTATLYALFSSLDAVGTLKNFFVPQYDFSPVLQPIVLDTFTDDNGTSLDAHTPDVDGESGGWTEQVGDWDIQGNKADPEGVSDTSNNATIATADFDVFIEAECITGDSTTNSVAGILLRYSDNTHFWQIDVNTSAGTLRLYENDGGYTERASSGGTVVADTSYRITVIADDETVMGFQDGGGKVSYASATFNKTVTTHGIKCYDKTLVSTISVIDHFAIWPRTSNAYDSEFGRFIE